MKSLPTLPALFSFAVASAQNVGIGTATPFAKLHLVDSANSLDMLSHSLLNEGFTSFKFFAGGGSLSDLTRFGTGRVGTTTGIPAANLTRLYAAGGPLLVGNSGNHALHLGTNDVERLRITGDGRIKINPALGTHDLFTFQVQGRSGESAGLFLNNGLTSGFPVVCIGRDVPATYFQTSTGEALAVISEGTDAIYCSSNSQAGIYALSTGNGAAGIFNGAGPAKLAVQLQGFIKVSGPDKTAFIHTATTANTSSHITTLSYANPLATDIVMATPNYSPAGVAGTYNNHPIGVYWNGTAWTVFNQDFANIVGTSYNIMVIRQ